MRRFLLILLLALAVSSPAWAARTATADTTGNWGTAANWDGPDTLPATGDDVVIPTGVNITLNGVYPAAGSFASVNVQAGGTLTVPVDANSGLTITGDSATGFTVAGIFQTAGSSVGNPVALGAGITCLISITPATDGGAGFIITSTGANYVAISGAVKTYFVSLAADLGDWTVVGDAAPTGATYPAGITSVTTDAVPTGWLDHDIVVFAPTGRTYSNWDNARLNGAPTTTTVAVEGWTGAAPTYSAGVGTLPAKCHQGAGTPTQARAEVLNLTRSFKIFSTSATLRTYMSAATTAVVTLSYVEAYNCGTTTAAKRALSVLTTTGSVTGTGCVFHDSDGAAAGQGVAVTALTTGSFTPTNWIVWRPGGHAWAISALTLSGAGALTATGCIGGYVTTASTYGFNILDVGSTFPSCRAVGNASSGAFISEALATVVDGFLDNFVAHSNGWEGVIWNSSQMMPPTADIAGLVSWRNTYGFYQAVAHAATTWLTSPVCFGSSIAQFAAASGCLNVSNPTDAETNATYQSPSTRNTGGKLVVTGGTIRGTHYNVGSLPVIVIGSVWNTFGAPTSFSDLGSSGVLVSFRHNNTADDHRAYYKYGNVLSNATERHTASGLDWQHNTSGGTGTWFRPNIPFSVRAKASQALTVKAWVARSGTNNGTAAPRIVILGGYLTGVASDVVGDSYTYAPATVAAAGVPGANRTSNIVTITTTAVHSLTTGDKVVVGGVTDTSFNGSFTVASTPTTTTFTYAQTAANGTSGSGWVGKWQQLTASATATESGNLPFVVEGQGSAGYYNVDDLTAVGAGAGKPEDYMGALGGAATVGPPGVGGWW